MYPLILKTMSAHRRPKRKKKHRQKKGPFRPTQSAQRMGAVVAPLKPMGLGGQKQAIVSVPVRLVAGRRIASPPEGDAGVYAVTVWLKKPNVALLADGDFRFGANFGDSHVMIGVDTHLEAAVSYNDGAQQAQLTFISNERGAVAGVRSRIQAPNFKDAEYHAIRLASPTLSLWSTLLDVPITIDRVETVHEVHGSSRLTVVNPFVDTSLRDVPSDEGSSSENLRVLASYYREAMTSNSDAYQLLCLFKIIEGVRTLRGTRLKEARRRGQRYLPAQIAEEVIPGDPIEFPSWLERIFPIRRSPWDEMSMESIFIPEARGRSIDELVQSGDRRTQRAPGPLCALRNEVAHSIGPGVKPLVADEALHLERVLHWLPITKCIVRLLLANEFPGELWAPRSRRELQERLVALLAGG